jgi:Lrp/AsnC family transcriptional regulator for asnA, asnC and gidA
MIDDFDLKLILEMQKNGRQSFLKLAKLLWSNERTIRNRIRKLIDKGVIEIVALPNLQLLGYKFAAFVAFQIDIHNSQSVGIALSKYPNIIFLSNVTGRYDYMALVVSKSAEDYSVFLENIISTTHGVIRVETYVTMNIVKGKGLKIITEDLIKNTVV